MKFLSICKVKDSFSMVPPSMGRQLMEATMTWTNQQVKAGKIVEIYSCGPGITAAICEHPDADDLNRVISTMPMSGFMHFDIYPLAEINSSMQTYIEAYKAAEKMFPAREMVGVR